MGYFQMWFRNFIKAHFYSGAHCFMQFFWFVFIFLPIFCHLIPKKRFLDICTSSYHALTCDYREFHAYLAPCGCGIWGCSERGDSTVDQSCVHSKVRPLQDSPALLTLPTLSGFGEVSGKNLKASAKCAGSWHTRVLLPILPSHQVSQLQMTQPCPCASGRRWPDCSAPICCLCTGGSWPNSGLTLAPVSVHC